jgi:hypothetical protein
MQSNGACANGQRQVSSCNDVYPNERDLEWNKVGFLVQSLGEPRGFPEISRGASASAAPG